MEKTKQISLGLGLAGLFTASVVAGESDFRTSSAPVIGDRIKQLESARDPKCYATANRIETYICGTPLSEEARFLKVDLQKRRIRTLWEAASKQARAAGKSTVTKTLLQPFIEPALKVERTDEGGVAVKLPEARTVSLAPADLNHYGSIAYSLRAILSVQQDDLLETDRSLLAMDADGVKALREFLDIYTLALLHLADRESREANHRDVTAEDLRKAAGLLGSANRMAERANSTGVSPSRTR